MEIRTVAEINQYVGHSVNPMENPDQLYELYSVPSFETGYPEIVRGKDIGSTKITVEEGDVLVCKINPRINRVWVVKHNTDHTLLASSEWIVIRNKELDSHYLKWYFSSPAFRKLLTSHVAGIGGSLTRAQPKQVAKYPIPVPDIGVQYAITNKLDKLSKLIALRKEQLAKLDQLAKSRFTELFGDVANSPKYGGVPLGAICTTLSGGTPTTKVPEYYNGDIPWISTPYLGDNHINGSSAKAYITEAAIKNSATHLIPGNTIMFGIRVGVGKSSIIDEPMCANQDIVALMGIDTNKYNLLFVKHVLDGYQRHFESIKKGATILGITTEDLKKVLIPTVDMELQNQFAAFVEQTDKLELTIQASLDKLELLKKSLMQEYFG